MRLRRGDSPSFRLWGRLAKVSLEARRGMGDKGLGRFEEANRGKVLVFLPNWNPPKLEQKGTRTEVTFGTRFIIVG